MKRRVNMLLAMMCALAIAPALASDRHFGAPFTNAKAVPLAEAMANVDKYAGKPIKIEGKIEDVCQEKGCWLVVTDGEREMRVSFKGYSFFVPKDSAGKQVVLEGVLERKVISEDHARHLAAESKKKVDPKTIKGSQQLIRLVASGVSIKE